jgi:hypothetical protein
MMKDLMKMLAKGWMIPGVLVLIYWAAYYLTKL